jgi:hypothetical protein
MGLAEDSENSAPCGVTSRHRREKFALSATIAAALLACVIPSALFAQTNVSPSNARPVNRYLFIIETSRAMQPRARGVFDAIKQAFDSGLSGQIQQGDLVGIWTFNEIVFQELFPTQAWSQPTQLAFAVRLPTFAEPKLYQKRARLDKVVPEMLKVMAENENVTIILITTGEGPLQETPFSAQISSAWKEWHDEQDGVHMPLQTVLRATNGKPTDWLVIPAPRPVELAKRAADPKPTGEKESNPAGVILESGMATNPPAVLESQQQIAFSVWAVGKTGLMASATSPQKISSPEPRPADSTPPATNMSNSKPSSATTTPVEPRITESAIITAKEEPNKSAVAVPISTAGGDVRNASDAPTVTSKSNAPTTDKPVELVFVTNAPVQAASVAESAAKESMPTTTAPSTPASPVADAPADHLSLLAHARAADPSQEETKSTEVALATAPRGFLRDNIQPLALMIVAGFGAVYCFRMWLRTNARSRGVSVSLAQETDEDSSHSEEAERSFVKRR